jgi:hypothetical protein
MFVQYKGKCGTEAVNIFTTNSWTKQISEWTLTYEVQFD